MIQFALTNPLLSVILIVMAQLKKYRTVELMQKAIDKYFYNCAKKKKPLTITGLALALGFTSRQALINYEKTEGYEKYFDTVKRAKLIVQNFNEIYLYEGKNPVGAIFNLKCNYNWEDKQVIEHSGNLEVSAKVSIKPLKKKCGKCDNGDKE